MIKRKINEGRAKEFKKIKQLTDQEVEPLIKLREGLEEAIKRVTRINQAFARELNKRYQQLSQAHTKGNRRHPFPCGLSVGYYFQEDLGSPQLQISQEGRG